MFAKTVGSVHWPLTLVLGTFAVLIAAGLATSVTGQPAPPSPTDAFTCTHRRRVGGRPQATRLAADRTGPPLPALVRNARYKAPSSAVTWIVRRRVDGRPLVTRLETDYASPTPQWTALPRPAWVWTVRRRVDGGPLTTRHLTTVVTGATRSWTPAPRRGRPDRWRSRDAGRARAGKGGKRVDPHGGRRTRKRGRCRYGNREWRGARKDGRNLRERQHGAENHIVINYDVNKSHSSMLSPSSTPSPSVLPTSEPSPSTQLSSSSSSSALQMGAPALSRKFDKEVQKYHLLRFVAAVTARVVFIEMIVVMVVVWNRCRKTRQVESQPILYSLQSPEMVQFIESGNVPPV